MAYDVDADIYEGPLALLVELTKLNLIDIFLVKLVELAESYARHVKAADERVSINELAEPLPLLGQLMAIKARGLLPQPPAVGEEEEVPLSLDELQRRLKEYEQFKTVAQLLAELHALQHQHFTRPPLELSPEEQKTDAAATPWELSLTDLMGAFSKVLKRAEAPVYEVKAELWTVEMKVQELRTRLLVQKQIKFLDLFAAAQSALELVVTFLALLELIRQRVAHAIQDRPFGEIVIAAIAVETGHATSQ